MLKLNIVFVIFLAGIFFPTAKSENGEIDFNSSFKRVGQLATGLSYGHIHGTMKFGYLKQAHKSVEEYLEKRLRETTSTNEKDFITMVANQLTISTLTLERLEFAFFHGEEHFVRKHQSKREKRQLFLGLAMGLGLISAGMSIYNTAETAKLHHEITNMKVGLKHVAHVLEEDHNAISALSKSVIEIKRMCRYIFDAIQNEAIEINLTQHMIVMSAMVQTHNSEILGLARGLEALMFGQLYPTLVDPHKLKKGLQVTLVQAKQKGLKLLNEEATAIYKFPVSYMATSGLDIIFIIHTPLVDMEPIDLYEYLPIPFMMGNLLVTIESKHQILATDSYGQIGLELSQLDLLQCQTEKSHHGNTFICPNTNLVINNIRKSCLGALFFGHKTEVSKHCHTFIQKTVNMEEFARQTSPNSFILFAKENVSIIKVCRNGTEILKNITGVTLVKANPDCRVVSETHTFKPQVEIDVDADFISVPMTLHQEKIIGKVDLKNLERAYNDMTELKIKKKSTVEELQKWLEEEENNSMQKTTSYVGSFGAMTVCGMILAGLGCLYCSFRRKQNVQVQK